MGLAVNIKWKPVGEKTRSICEDAKHHISTLQKRNPSSVKSYNP
jgi:hypothetical protein